MTIEDLRLKLTLINGYCLATSVTVLHDKALKKLIRIIRLKADEAQVTQDKELARQVIDVISFFNFITLISGEPLE